MAGHQFLPDVGLRLSDPPVPYNYRVLTRRLPSFGAAVAVKNRYFHRWGCSLWGSAVRRPHQFTKT
ncbi:MAG: hypothetical protein P8Y53_04565 [Pseudolabrys sp.]|jgi:hypothetical protein